MSDEPLDQSPNALLIGTFAILFLIVGAVAAFFIGVWIADHLRQTTQAATTTSEQEQEVPDCVVRIAHEFDSENQNRMRALAQESGITFEDYRRMIIVTRAMQERPKP
jgi:hypothetical protein